MSTVETNACPPDAPVENNTETLEESVYERINHYRDMANQMEAALLRLPPAVRRLTRAQARSVHIYL